MTMKRGLIPKGVFFIPAIGAMTVLLLTDPALAGPRYQKTKDVRVQAKQTHLTKVKTKPKEAAPTRPAIMAEQFKQSTAARVAKLTDQAISTLKRLIKVTGNDDPEKPDFFFRLAEHYRDKKVQYMFRARELDEKIYQASTAGEKQGFKARQKSYERFEKKWMLEAIKMYLHIAQKSAFAKYDRMDEVLYNVADMLNQANRRDRARIFFSKLIRNFPQSKYIPDAYLSFAEYYFAEGKVEKALRLYEQVGKYKESPVYGYSVYKQGWCWLNLQDPRRALEMFVRVIKNSKDWAGPKKSKIILVKEAKKDSVRAYAHVGTPAKAWNFFQRIGGSYGMKMLEMLAQVYYDQGKFVPTIQVYHKLIELNPASHKLCTWQYNIVKSTLSTKNKKDQVVESKRLAAVYQESKKRGKMKKNALAECRSNASGVLRELATTWHREAQKTMNQDTYAMAQYLYKEYLENFPNEKDSYVMHYYFAELLFKLERWQPAAEAYTKVVKMKKKGKFLKEAAYAAVISWKNALNVAEETKEVKVKKRGKKGKKAKEEVAKALPIPDRQQKMIAAFDTYIKYVPKADELVPIMYRKARIYYTHNHYDKAVKMFADIVVKHPEHELAEYAANLLLDSLNILKKFDQLNKWVNRLMKEPKIAKGEFLAQLRTLKRGAQWKEAEQLQKNGMYRMCGEKYSKIANEYPEDKRWPDVVYNAALCYEAAKLIGMAIKLRTILIKTQPKHPRAQAALYMVGANYHALAWYSRAAAKYEEFAKNFPGEKEAPEALQNAIVFRMGRGEYDKAIDDTRFFTKKFGARRKLASRVAAVNFSLGSIYEQRRDSDSVIKHYNGYLRKWGKKGGKDRQIQANFKIGNTLWKQSCPTKGINGACIKIKRVRSKRKVKKRSRRKKKRTIEMKSQCGPETKMRVTLTKRDKRKARKAQNHFRKALAIYKRMGGGKGVRGATKEERLRRKTSMRYAAAASLFYQAEAQYEKFLEVKFPKNLDFSPKNKKKKKKSEKAFRKYIEIKAKKLGQSSKNYQDVIMMKVPHWAIAAAARIGQLHQNFADALYTATIPKPTMPKGLRTNDQKEDFIMMYTDAYCDALEVQARPLEAKALQGLGLCLQKSTELSWYNEWSTLCEAELNQIKPAEFPLASEIRAKPGYVTYKADRASVIEEIK